LFNETAELATQRPATFEASPLPISAKTPLGDDDASPNFDAQFPLCPSLVLSICHQRDLIRPPGKSIHQEWDKTQITHF
jgi:hypothetical protein